jgi:hypothetical protein
MIIEVKTVLTLFTNITRIMSGHTVGVNRRILLINYKLFIINIKIVIINYI